MANSQTFTLNIKAVSDMNNVVSNIKNIQTALGKLKFPDNLKTSFKTTFNSLERELDNYQKLMSSGFKTKGDANALTKSGNNILRLYDDIVKKINSIDDSTLKKAFEDIGVKEVENLRNQLTGLENDLKSKLNNQKILDFTTAKNELKTFKTEITGLTGDAEKAFKTLSNSTFNTFVKNLDTGRLDLAAQNLAKIRQQADAIGNTKLSAWVTKLEQDFAKLQQDSGISNLTSNIEKLKQDLLTIKADTLEKLVQQFKDGSISAETFQNELHKTITAEENLAHATAQTNSELSQVKSRIQYFFGLNNAINLVKRSIRDAVNTIKELDKAMTETAVVTDFSVADMWAQLPEYTKRANELGVTTKAAYEAATLYYQQGLNTNEVMAMSNETLKMARIAGLDAAEATDRMTNAIRGFNMEINTTNAQRIDDVYSRLAAISASNVDEISTAMTKVASLAHSANMEFETTAAFLAQIIETTRESAETAGTALKTVVARFSEVKKLVDEGQLSGSDEEGEIVDVNKVSQALRTAGIDLNKYFLGEVGLDDIFMELASKWDSLTTIEQRYIATQAAGSRQQSRFIALMSDYARTQELVGEAYSASGAAQTQFEKTQDSLQSKLALLKNAWDRFIMGVTNNVVIKGAVDALTTLLNVINNLTESFGEGTGSILKMTTAILALSAAKKAFATGGFLDVLLTGLKGNFLGTALGTAGTAGSAAGLGQMLGAALGKSLLGKGLGAVGTGITGGALAAGSLGAIVTGLGAVAAAAGVAYLAYKKIYDLSPEGQLKALEKQEQKLKDIAAEAEKTAKAQADTLKEYQSKDEQVANATSGVERLQAIKERNDYILSLLEKDNTYAKYVQSMTEEGGQIVLTLDEDALAEAAEKAAKAATESAIEARRAAIETNQQRVNVAENNVEKYNNNIKYLESFGDDYVDQIEEFSAEVVQQQGVIQEATENMRGEARLLYQDLFDSDIIGVDAKNALSDAFAQIVDITGALTEDQASEIETLVGSTGLQAFLDAINNVDTSTPLTGIENVNELLNALGITADGDIDAFSRLEKILGLDADQAQKLTKRLKDYAVQQRAQQQTSQTNLQSKFQNLDLEKAGSEWLDRISVADQARVNNFANQLDTLVNQAEQKKIFEQIFNAEDVENSVREAQVLLNSLDMDHPIRAYRQLNEAINDSSNAVRQQLAQGIKDSNNQIFSTSNLVQSVLKSLSTEYEDVQKQVDKLIKKNGKLTAENILELADACEDLHALLEDNIISAEDLADALTMIEDGTIAFEDLTDVVLEAIENTETFANIVEKLHEYINNWEDAEDYGEGIDFFAARYKDLQELVDNFEFGNPKTQKIWEAIFGPGYMDAWNEGEDAMRQRIQQFADWIDNDAHGFFTDKQIAATLGLEILPDDNVKWDKFEASLENGGFANWDEVIASIREAAHAAGNDISEEAAMAILEAWVAHGDITVTEAKNQIDINSISTGLADVFKDTVGPKILTDGELHALAEEWKVPFETLKQYIHDNVSDIQILGEDDISIPDLGEWIERKLGETKESIIQHLQTSGIVITDENGIPVEIDADALKLYLNEKGIVDPSQQAAVAKQIASDLDLELNKDVDLPLKIAEALDVEVDSEVVKKLSEAIEKASTEKPIEVTLQKVIIKGINEISSENKEEVAEILSEGLSSLTEGESIDVILQDVTAKLKEANITPDDPDYLTTISSILSAYYGESGNSVELTVNEVKTILSEAGVNLTDAEIDGIVTKANQYIEEYNPDGLVLTIGNAKVHVNSAVPPDREEIFRIAQAALDEGATNSTDLLTIIYKAALQAGATDLEATKIAAEYQAAADKQNIVFGALLKAKPVGVDYTYNQVTGTDTFSGAELTGKAGGSGQVDVSQITGSQLDEWVSRVGKIKLTFENEAEAKAKIEQLESEIEQDGLKLKINTDNPENADGTYSIEVEPKGLLNRLNIQAQSYQDDPLDIPAELDLNETPSGETPAVDAKIDHIATSNSANSDIENVGENVGNTMSEKTESGLSEGAEGGAQVIDEKAEEAAQYIFDKFSNGEIEAADLGAETIRISAEREVSASTVGSILLSKLETAGSTAAGDLATQITAAINSITATITVYANVVGEGNATANGGYVSFSGTVAGQGSTAATGGIVSAAGGLRKLTPGPALTGEEDTEIVWNKEKGYAYLVGENGPQFTDLQAGDRVFNAAETRRIMRNSVANGGVVPAYATGRWNRNNDGNISSRRKRGGSGGSGSSGSDKESTPTVWENDLDWLYNLVEDISELERTQTKLAEKHDRYLNDISKTGRDLYNISQQQLNNLYTQRDNQREMLTRRRQEMAEQIGISGYGNYVQWNDKDQTIEIDWDAIEAIQDKETYDEVKDLISKAEKIQDEMDAARDALWDIEDQIKEIEERYLQEFTEFQSRILDAVVHSYQVQIDNLESLNDTLNDTNSSILESLQKEIEYSRQIRDNTDTERNIADMEARLAYLRRDTTGGNESEIRDLEKQLEDARQGYEDTLIDQSLEKLSEANEKATEQRQQQIDLMTAQLNYWQETGALWDEVAELMAEGMGSDGSLIRGSKLETTLANAEGWKAMSEEQREVWANDLIKAANQAGAYLIKISQGFDSLSAGIWAMLPNTSITSQKLDYGDKGSQYAGLADGIYPGFSSGGLVDKTGLAKLHGTASAPEYVLNAQQTGAFLKLADVLPSIMGGGNTTNNNLGGNVYVELSMNVGSISNDYDVDRMVDRIKSDIYDASSYRNTNAINHLR